MTKKKRRAFSRKIRKEELRKAKYKCRDCKKRLDFKNKLYHFNHKRNNWDNSQKNCEVLCLNCHWKKTRKQLKKIPHSKRVKAGKKAWRRHRDSWKK